MKRALIPVFACIFASFLTGCSLRAIAVRQMAPILETGAPAFYDESDPELAKEAMPALLKTMDALALNDPAGPGFMSLASQAYGGYSFLFLEDAHPERAKNFYLRSRDYGLKLLARNPKFAGLPTMNLAQLADALKGAGAADVSGLFWGAYGWAGFINLSRDDADAIADLPKAVAMMEKVRDLSPRFYFAGASLFLGSYYASRPKILGGDTAKAKLYFDEAESLTQGKFLTTYLLEAKYYAVATQDQELFKSLAQKIKDMPAGALPQSRLADEVAKRKAAVLLEKINDYF